MASLFTGGVFQAIGSTGLALPGALLYSYAAGGLTPLATHTDQGGLSDNANPVVCDAAGQASVWLGTATYRFILKTAAGVTVWDRDNVSSFAALNDLSSTSSTTRGDALIGVKRTVTSYATTQHAWHESQPVNVRSDSAAVGDGATNDTSGLNVALAANRSATLGDGTFLATPPAGASLADITRDYAHIAGPGCFKVRSGTYYLGTPGAVDTYAYYRVSGHGAVVFGTGFDGNSQATILPYQPAGENVYFYPVNLYGDKQGQKAIANHSTGAGGHAVEGSNGTMMVVALNSAEEHNGIGTTNTEGLAIIGNVSADATDSHYYVNTDDTVTIVGNAGRGNTGGGGLDLAGATSAVAVGNAFTGGSANAVWALKSPNTATVYQRLLIASNLAYNNCSYPNNYQGEIQLGDYNNLAVAQGSDVAVIGNFVLPQDTPGGSGFNNGVWIHAGNTRTAVIGNVISPDAALITASQPVVRDMGSTKPIIAGNVSFGDTPGLVYWDAAPTTYAYYANNVNMRIHPSSVGLPSAMESSDGVWNYHIVRSLTKAGKTVMDIFYTGAGYVHDVIEITLSQANDNGAVSHRITARGVTAAATSVVINTTLFSVGTNPPVVTLNTAVNGRLRITAATAAGGFDNELCAFNIRITTPDDRPSRFVPVFA
jgi:hypothetical protein